MKTKLKLTTNRKVTVDLNELKKRIGAIQERERMELVQLLFNLREAKDEMLDNPDMCSPHALLVDPILKLEKILKWGERWKQEQEGK